MPSTSHIAAAIEALLFVSGEPLSFSRLAKTLKADEKEISAYAEALSEKHARDGESGLMLVIKDRKVLLATKPEHTSVVEALSKSLLQEHLSKPALEVLSIIAYRAPITRAEIEAIRGVNCSFTLRNLLLRDLIERQGNPADARGYIYSPTFKFLQSLGLKDMRELPEYTALSQDERLTMVLEENPTQQKETEY